MHAKHMIGCLVVAGVVAAILVALGAPLGMLTFVLICPLMMVGMMFFMGGATRHRQHAGKP
jgi:hypothetical protein